MIDNERKNLPSASSFRRYELCNGSFQLELEAERLGQSAHRKSPAADTGTRIHAWIEGDKSVGLNEDESRTAAFLKERGDEQVTRIFGDAEFDQIYEKRLWLDIDGKPALSGRFDRVSYTANLVLVQDWKTGWSEPQAAEQNAQMKVLAVLVALSLPKSTEIVVQVISGPYGVTEARYDIAALGEAYNEIVATLRAIGSPAAAFNPSPEACKYCGAKLICQALKDQVVTPMTKVQLSALPDGGPRAAKLLDEVTILKGLLGQIEEFYSAKLNADPAYDLPGYAIVPGVIRREVTDWETARIRLEEYIDADEIRGAAAYRLGDIEKALGKKLKLKGKPLKEKLGEILHGLIEEKQNAGSLKRVSGQPKIKELVSV